ncbi:phage tail tape measure protein [Romboutsia ilealis]|uniref:phage tail tape measure protein n=1 Tax=Romboutsia ilealis TaxID=1115758 RepID=UPI00257424F4|nr:phage tail tape measure protein [Romboutsia ilealis]
MSEEIEKLSVALALDSGSFSKQISSINKEIKNAERNFKSAGKGVENFEKSFVGLDSKIQKISKQLDLYNIKLDKQKQEYEKLSSIVEKQKSKLEELESTVGKGSEEWKKQAELVQKNSEKLSRLSSDINNTESNINQLNSELDDSVRAFEELGNKTKTIDEKLEDVGRQANLTESEFNKLGSELQGTGNYFATLGNDISRLSSKIEQNAQKLAIYEDEVKKLGTTLDKNKQDHQQLAQQINKTETELTQAKSAYGENSTEVQQLNQKLLQLKDRYNSVETEIEQNSNALNEYQTEINNTQAEINQLSNELKQLPFDRIGNDLISSGQKIKGVGQDLTSNLTVPIVGAGTAMGVMTYNFDQGLAKVGSLVGKSGKEMKEYETVIQSLSRETGIGLDEMTEAMYQGISAGADLNNIFGLLETATKLSIGGFTSSETAIDGLTTAMNAFGISYEDVADKFILTQNKGKTTVDALASSIGKVAPIAVSAGVSLEELLAATASLTMNGIETSEAMTALKAGFSNIIKPSSEAAKMAESLGINFNSTALESMGLAGFLDMVKEATGGNLDTMAKLFGSTEALNAILVLTGEGADEFSGVLDSMGDSAGLAEEAFNGMKESAGAQLLDAINSLKVSLTDMGDTLAPIIEWLAQKISELSDWFSNLDEDAQKNIVTMAGLAAAIGPVLMTVGNLLIVGGNVVTLFGKLSTSTAGAGTATGIFSNGLGVLSKVALPAAIAALVGIMAKIGDNEDAILSLQEKYGGFGTSIGAICEFISGVVDITIGYIIELFKGGFDVIAAIIDGPGGLTVKDATSKMNENLNLVMEEGMQKLALTTTRGMSQMRNASDIQLQGTVESMETIMNAIPNIVDGKYRTASQALGSQLSAMDATQITILQGMNDTTQMMFEGIRQGMSVDEASKKVEQNLKQMAIAGKIDAQTMEKDVTKALEQMKKQMDTKTKEGSKAIDTNTKDASNKANANSSKMASDYTKNVNKMASEGNEELSKVPQDVDTQMAKAGQATKKHASDMYTGVTTSFSKMASNTKQSASDMYNGTTTSSSLMSTNAKQSASSMYNGVTTSTRLMADAAIADWERIRSAYSRSISGTITITTKNITVNETVNKSVSKGKLVINENYDKYIELPKPVNISKYDLSGSYYSPDSNVSNVIKSINQSNSDFSNLEKKLDTIANILTKNKSVIQENNITINSSEPLSPSQVARQTRKELEKLGRRV